MNQLWRPQTDRPEHMLIYDPNQGNPEQYLSMRLGFLRLGFVVDQPPVEEGIVDEGLQHGHQGVLVPEEQYI